jgi:small subunit ribosomal protein S2
LGFGHKAAKTHPRMKPYIDKVKDGVQLINLDKTIEKLDEALAFLKSAKKEGKEILIVGTNPALRSIVKEAAEEAGTLYVVERWIGGTLTNFKEIRKRIKYFNDLETKTKQEDFTKNYNKKERLMINKELERLKLKFGGIKKIERSPDIIFIVDTTKDEIALKEAFDSEKTVIALVDTNCNPVNINYPIPANDDSVSSVKYILDKVVKSIK